MSVLYACVWEGSCTCTFPRSWRRISGVLLSHCRVSLSGVFTESGTRLVATKTQQCPASAHSTRVTGMRSRVQLLTWLLGSEHMLVQHYPPSQLWSPRSAFALVGVVQQELMYGPWEDYQNFSGPKLPHLRTWSAPLL